MEACNWHFSKTYMNKEIYIKLLCKIEFKSILLLSTVSILYSRCEELITEEVQWSYEHDSGIVTGLEGSDQQGVLTNRMGVLETENKQTKD